MAIGISKVGGGKEDKAVAEKAKQLQQQVQELQKLAADIAKSVQELQKATK